MLICNFMDVSRNVYHLKTSELVRHKCKNAHWLFNQSLYQNEMKNWHMYILKAVQSKDTLPDPYEWVVELWVDGLQVFEDKLLVQHAFVERQREACVDELAVEKCLQKRIVCFKRENLINFNFFVSTWFNNWCWFMFISYLSQHI